LYPWLKFLHIALIFGFLLSHGVSVSIFYALRRERNFDRIRLLLQLSASSYRILLYSLLALLLLGVIAGFVGNWWGYGWIWAGLILLMAIYASMSMLGSRILNNVRQGIGLPTALGLPPRSESLSAEEVDALLSRIQPTLLTVIGYGGIALIAWLMVLKPF
jgi:hypothetical protein